MKTKIYSVAYYNGDEPFTFLCNSVSELESELNGIVSGTDEYKSLLKECWNARAQANEDSDLKDEDSSITFSEYLTRFEDRTKIEDMLFMSDSDSSYFINITVHEIKIKIEV